MCYAIDGRHLNTAVRYWNKKRLLVICSTVVPKDDTYIRSPIQNISYIAYDESTICLECIVFASNELGTAIFSEISFGRHPRPLAYGCALIVVRQRNTDPSYFHAIHRPCIPPTYPFRMLRVQCNVYCSPDPGSCPVCDK